MGNEHVPAGERGGGICIGVDYYPEQWEPALWCQDADQMREIGVRLVRMAEFAWSRLEPEEGMFDFAWLDQAISVFADRGIAVFLCTPTCTPPQWLFERYPEVIQMDSGGQRIPIGIRGHRCMNSPVYRAFCEKIIRKMVSRYRDNPAVIGYQIDNELEANHCRCPVCAERFRTWVQEKYRTVQRVNKAYGNTVWSGEYSDFSQVKPPMGPFTRWQNPSLTLDFNRYASDSTVEYLEFQRELIHSLDQDALITTNNWLCENMPDFYDMFHNLDFVSYDNYPVAKLPADSQELYSHAFHLDLMRGIKQKNFWIMEQLSGPVGSWMPMSPALRPGMLKGYALQAIAHGADAVLHFRWRTGVSGAEMFWHGILDHSNVPGRRYQEFADLCATVNGMPGLAGSVVENRVAVLYGSDQEYGFKLQHQAEGMYYMEQLKSLHDAFTGIGVGVDIVGEKADFSTYNVILAPTMFITHSEIVDKLYEFVDNGGTVVLTNRSGVKDEYNKCIMSPLPTVYTDLIGAHVTEYDVIGSAWQSLQLENEELSEEYMATMEQCFCEELSQGNTTTVEKASGEKNREPVLRHCRCTQWCDLLETDTAETLAVYGDQFYAGTPAVTRNVRKKGCAYYIGTVADRAFYISLAKVLAKEQGLSYVSDLPLGVEVSYRRKGDRSWRFVFNNTMRKQRVRLGEDAFTLEPFEMKINSLC